MPTPQDVTVVLNDLERGENSAAERLLPLVYDELLALARTFFASQPAGHTLQPTALVHEVFLRVAGSRGTEWSGRAHFMAVAATAMRQILISHARAKHAEKRGGHAERITLNEAIAAPPPFDVDLMELDEILTELQGLDERAARIIELRFFGGLSIDETAHVLGVSSRTIELDWRMARAWLLQHLHETGGRV